MADEYLHVPPERYALASLLTAAAPLVSRPASIFFTARVAADACPGSTDAQAMCHGIASASAAWVQSVRDAVVRALDATGWGDAYPTFVGGLEPNVRAAIADADRDFPAAVLDGTFPAVRADAEREMVAAYAAVRDEHRARRAAAGLED